MKKGKISKILSLLLVFSLITASLSFSVSADTNKSNQPIQSTLQIAKSYATAQIQQISKDIKESTWTKNTAISDTITLYDANESPNGYIFNLTTQKKPSGYIRVSVIDNQPALICYAFREHSPIDKMLAKHDKTIIAAQMQRNQIIISSGSCDYVLQKGTETSPSYFDLSTQAEVPVSKSELINADTQLKKNIQQSNTIAAASTRSLATLSTTSARSLSASSTTYPHYVAGADWHDLVFMDEFTEYRLNGDKPDNHCGPTAGTNIIKYWAHERNVTQLWNSTQWDRWNNANADWWVFSSLCVNMKTKFHNTNPLLQDAGTDVQNAYYGLRNYSTNTRSVSYSGCDWKDCNWNNITTLINQSVPLMMRLSTYTSKKGNVLGSHIITCFGYYISSSGSLQVIINDDLNQDWTYTPLSVLKCTNMFYIRWDGKGKI